MNETRKTCHFELSNSNGRHFSIFRLIIPVLFLFPQFSAAHSPLPWVRLGRWRARNCLGQEYSLVGHHFNSAWPNKHRRPLSESFVHCNFVCVQEFVKLLLLPCGIPPVRGFPSFGSFDCFFFMLDWRWIVWIGLGSERLGFWFTLCAVLFFSGGFCVIFRFNSAFAP